EETSGIKYTRCLFTGQRQNSLSLRPSEGESSNISPISFKVIWSKQKPYKPFAAVRYQVYWFCIDNSDINRKWTLGLIIAFFRL
ncbi:MAG: hypothetical protein OEU55_16115, partial [Desulfobacterales bacterium]|nr:hypothetical protein [Desulfobacterales bacterium]